MSLLRMARSLFVAGLLASVLLIPGGAVSASENENGSMLLGGEAAGGRIEATASKEDGASDEAVSEQEDPSQSEGLEDGMTDHSETQLEVDDEEANSDLTSNDKQITGATSVAPQVVNQVQERPQAEVEDHSELATPVVKAGDPGLVRDAHGLRYQLADGSFAKNSWRDAGGRRYYFGSDGYAMRWRQTIGGKVYYFDSGCRMVTGWVRWNADGSWSYFGADGAAMRWRQTIGGKVYYFDGSCKRVTGWVRWNADGTRSYFHPSSGAALSGWQTIGGKVYYFDPARSCASARWRQTIGGKVYYFDGSCRRVTGAVRWNSNGRWSIFGSDGAQVASGWVTVGGARYYVGSDGYAVQWLQTIGGKHYYFDSGCRMVTGWVRWSADSRWSYFGSDGVMLTGTHVIGGVRYTFDSNGRTSQVPRPSDQQKMLNKAQSYSSSTRYLVLVNCSTNRVGIFTGSKGNWNLSKYWQCTTGAASTPTVLGQYTVQGKGYSFGSGYTCYYYTQFYGDYLFHSILYRQGTHVVQDGRLGQNLSLGCVRLELSNAKWIYDNIPRGTKVVTYR